MSRPRNIDPKMVLRASALISQAKDARQLRAAQAILLPAKFGLTLEQTASTLGVGRSEVHRLQQEFRKTEGVPPTKKKRNWGGRRRSLMRLEEEKEFLKPWAGKAFDAGIVVASPIRAALAEKLGRPVTALLVYRLLERHGWRKVAPDTRHPKADSEAQETWKKNSRRCWQPS